VESHQDCLAHSEKGVTGDLKKTWPETEPMPDLGHSFGKKSPGLDEQGKGEKSIKRRLARENICI